jgi:hypothetical protein
VGITEEEAESIESYECSLCKDFKAEHERQSKFFFVF